MNDATGHDVIVVGASYGGVQALAALARALPPELPAAVVIALHTSAGPTSLPAILDRSGPLRAAHAIDGERLEPNRIYLAPPNRHLLVRPGSLALSAGPRENRCRPSIDVLFRSAAVAYRARVVGVVLTGFLFDGAAGLSVIKRCGGVAVIQDPREAASPSMPNAAAELTEIDHAVPIARMGELLDRLARQPAAPHPPHDDRLDLEVAAVASVDNRDLARAAAELGARADISCPDCGGALHVLGDGITIRFRCLLGHSHTGPALLDSQGDEVERALWSSVRALEERVQILRNLAGVQRAADRGLAAAYDERARQLATHAFRLRTVLCEQ